VTPATPTDKGKDKEDVLAKIALNKPLAYLIALQIIHSEPTGNDIHDAILYRDLYPRLKHWLEYLEQT